jgi:hypothetical protein
VLLFGELVHDVKRHDILHSILHTVARLESKLGFSFRFDSISRSILNFHQLKCPPIKPEKGRISTLLAQRTLVRGGIVA